MTKQTQGLDPSLYSYFLSISLREDPALQRLREETEALPMARMQIAPEQGQFMALLVQLIGAQKTLEVGVFTGYSALAVALVLPPKGKMVACEVNADYAAIAQEHWQKAGVADKIELKVAPALETLDELIATGETNSFDFVFIDADKRNYDNYYEKALQLVRPQGLIAVDNVLWYGKVANENIQDNSTRSIRAFNQKLHRDQRVHLSLIPIADGLTLAMKRA